MANWRDLITSQMKADGESFEDVEHSVFAMKAEWGEKQEQRLMTDAELDREFDNGYGGSEGCNFTIWTKNRVYFPVVYDGAEWVSSVPRNPCNEAMSHVGGE